MRIDEAAKDRQDQSAQVIASNERAEPSLETHRIYRVDLGMAIAVLVDATIIRCLLVPATMRLVGRWNWWLPGRPPALCVDSVPQKLRPLSFY